MFDNLNLKLCIAWPSLILGYSVFNYFSVPFVQ